MRDQQIERTTADDKFNLVKQSFKKNKHQVKIDDSGFICPCNRNEMVDFNSCLCLFFHNLLKKPLYFQIFPLHLLCCDSSWYNTAVSHLTKIIYFIPSIYCVTCWIRGLTELFLKSICLSCFHLFLAVKICGSYMIAHSNSLSPGLLLQFKAINPARGG